MTVPVVAAKDLKRAYPVFLGRLKSFGDRPIDTPAVLDALADLTPNHPPAMIIALFKRCAALSDLLSKSPPLRNAQAQSAGSIFKAAAVARAYEESQEAGTASTVFDETEFSFLLAQRDN